MEKYEGILDIEIEKITSDIAIAKELARVNNIINNIKMYKNNIADITNLLTDILVDDNVYEILTKLSKELEFVELFPEFYIKNEYGEDVINCQQNSTYHKYGVFGHILHTIEYAGNSQIPVSSWQKKILKWTMLLHDIGKPYVKKIYEDGSESFAGHEDVSVEISKGILDRFLFTDTEKEIILTLVKYHDKYLNDGELTNDNFKFLASELKNDSELFNMLIEVKEADARAKNIDVYNRYKITKNKFLEFSATYFSSQNTLIEPEKAELDSSLDSFNIKDLDNDSLTKSEMDILLDSVISKKNIMNLYQPIIDINSKKVYGYELLTKIEFEKKIDILDLFNYAIETEKYDKLQQILFVNGIDNFETIHSRESDTLFINIDITSYEKYINKPRIYEMMTRQKMVISFSNYDKVDIVKMQNIFDTIHKNNGYIALHNFGIGSLDIDDINILNIDYIIPDMSIIKDIDESDDRKKYISDLVTYCLSKETNLVLVGIEDKHTLDLVKQLGIKYVQGFYFQTPKMSIEIINSRLEKLIDTSDDIIT